MMNEFSELRGRGLSGDREHLAESSAELEVGLALPLVLGLVQVTSQLDEVVGHVVFDEGRQGRWALKDSGPRLKLGDIVAEVSAVLKDEREALGDRLELFDTINPLAVE